MQTKCKTFQNMKGWSQNLGHDQMAATLINYGKIDTEVQGEIMERLAKPQSTSEVNPADVLEEAARQIRQSDLRN